MSHVEPKDCHICGLPIDVRPGKNVSPLGLSQDHLKPKSNGGGNERSNLSPAHRYCNNMRGSQEITDELRERCRSKLLQEHGPLLADLAKKSQVWKTLRSVKLFPNSRIA